MKKLRLQVNKKHFQAILKGDVKVENRNIYPANASRYVVEEDFTDENGEPATSITPVHYDAIQFTCGRREDSPRAVLEIKESDFIILTDEEGNDLTYKENGEEYYICILAYTLGNILSTENVEQI